MFSFWPTALPDTLPGFSRCSDTAYPVWSPLCSRGQFLRFKSCCKGTKINSKVIDWQQLFTLYVRYSQWTSLCTIECQEDQEELSPSPTEEPWPKKFPEPLSWRSDEEDEDSDFGEEQRDRYLKVSLSVWKGYIPKSKCFAHSWTVSEQFLLFSRWAFLQSTRTSSSSYSASSALC